MRKYITNFSRKSDNTNATFFLGNRFLRVIYFTKFTKKGYFSDDLIYSTCFSIPGTNIKVIYNFNSTHCDSLNKLNYKRQNTLSIVLLTT